MSAVGLVTGAAVKIERDRLRCVVDINLRRGDVVDEITVRQIENSVFMGAPWTLDSIRDRELDIAAIMVREVEVITPQRIGEPIGCADSTRGR